MLRHITKSTINKATRATSLKPPSSISSTMRSLPYRTSHRTISMNLLNHERSTSNEHKKAENTEKNKKSIYSFHSILLTGLVVAGLITDFYKKLYYKQLKTGISAGDYTAISDLHNENVKHPYLISKKDILTFANGLSKSTIEKFSPAELLLLLEMIPAKERFHFLESMYIGHEEKLLEYINLKNRYNNLLFLFTQKEFAQILLGNKYTNLGDILNDSSKLIVAYKYLLPEDRAVLTKKLEINHIVGCIKSPEDFKEILYYLSEDAQCDAIKQIGSENLKKFANHDWDLTQTTRTLTPSNKRVLLDMLGDEYIRNHIIKDGFTRVIGIFSPEHQRIFINQTTDFDLRKILNSTHAFHILNSLEDDHQQSIIIRLGSEYLRNMILVPENLNIPIRDTQYQIVLATLGREHLRKMITKPVDLLNLTGIYRLSTNKYHAVLDFLGMDYVRGLVSKSDVEEKFFNLPESMIKEQRAFSTPRPH